MSKQEKTETTTRNVEPGYVEETTKSTTVARERENIQGPVTWEEMRMLLRREPSVVERTWRPTVGGLLAIIAGSWNFLLGLGALVGGTIFSDLIPTFGGVTGGISTTGITAGIILIIIGLISIVGGSYALSRSFWPMALAGSIAALIPTPLILPFLMGFFSLIFVVLGHREFWAKSRHEIT